MKKLSHSSAKASHYNKEAANYDIFNEKNSITINKLIEKIFKKYKVQNILDITCGTGSQVFYLLNKGYEIVGSDINTKMLNIAKHKAKQQNIKVKLIKGDMRTIKLGQFDAVISIFNAIGHLTKKDFEKSIQNINAHLSIGGLYIFDIFNLDYLLTRDNITHLTIDWLKKSNDSVIREIQYSTVDTDGVLASYDFYHKQVKGQKSKISQSFQTLQVYTANQLKEMLQKNGFKVLRQSGIDGSRFNRFKTERILMQCSKIRDY